VVQRRALPPAAPPAAALAMIRNDSLTPTRSFLPAEAHATRDLME